MSLDKTLNLSAAKKPQIVDQKDARRVRLMKRIEDQITIVEAVKRGEEPSKPYRRRSRWFWAEGGEYYVYLQYARHALELAKGRFSVKCTDIDGMIEAFKALSQAVSKGQFDEQIQLNSSKIRKRFEIKKAA